MGAKVFNDRYFYPILAIPHSDSIRFVMAGELPPYNKLKETPPLDSEDDAAIISGMNNLDLGGANSSSKETARIIKFDEEASLVAVDVGLAGKLVVGVDDNGCAWVWVGSCDFARDES